MKVFCAYCLISNENAAMAPVRDAAGMAIPYGAHALIEAHDAGLQLRDGGIGSILPMVPVTAVCGTPVCTRHLINAVESHGTFLANPQRYDPRGRPVPRR